ncbi:MAG: phosphatidate cytidylyltransferase [Pirellulales bacterium]|nr:phosphatidate cytidylyltransferase [Pirellulales bacterium]
MVPRDWILAAIVVTLLAVATVVGQLVQRQPQLGLNTAALTTFNRRVRVWWLIYAILLVAYYSPTLTLVIFCAISFEALREFITITPTRSADHRALFWTLFIFTPLQYLFVGSGKYELYSIFIPVFGFLFIPARAALAGDYKRFLERVAKVQSGLLICVYCLSFAPALLYLQIPKATAGEAPRLLFFFVTLALLSEAFQFIWSQLYGRHVISPAINESRTWEGLIGGATSTALVGMLLHMATPFPYLWQSAFMAMVIAIMGFAGAMTMSAIKRDRGVRDYGTLVEGHGGILDRIDAICFAAPVFFQITRHLLGAG